MVGAESELQAQQDVEAPSLQIDDPAEIALFLDLDGTLLDIAAAPGDVSAPAGLSATLQRLQRTLSGAVAILTGRTIGETDCLLSPLKLPGAGVHGAELRVEPEGDIEVISGSVPAPLVAAVERLASSIPGVFVEHKRLALAVHYRAAPALEPMLETELRGLLDTHTNRLVLSHGRRVLELAPRESSKGTALKRLMQAPRFEGRRPVMIGDDLPDEAALDIATSLGGVGLKVGGEHFRRGGTHFSGPAQVR
ncbi:MAG TPA: trehalose-phosphatase, partial [Methyloceanibacter sp.]|nr:trehalose-phosphatase [Methyloceanibacter sp.]